MPDPVPSVPDELVAVATRALDEWPWRTGSLTISTGMLARAVLEAVSEAGWVRRGEYDMLRAFVDRGEYADDVRAEAIRERDEARARSEALRDEGRKFADWLERDRRESDKVLCVVQSMRRAFRESQEPDHAA